MRMISGGKWAPLKLIAIVVLPHGVLLVMAGDHTANGLKCNFATKPFFIHLESRRSMSQASHRIPMQCGWCRLLEGRACECVITGAKTRLSILTLREAESASGAPAEPTV